VSTQGSGSRGNSQGGSRGDAQGGSRDSRRRALQQAKAAEARRKRQVRLTVIGGSVVVVGGIVGGLLAAGIGSSGSTPASSRSPGAGAGTSTATTTGTGPAKYAALSTLGTLQAPPTPGALGPEQVPVPNAPALAGIATAVTGQNVDGISCSTAEQTLFHIHAHLTIFVNGAPRQVPAAIGIPNPGAQNTAAGPFIATGSCFYWLHTHAADGIVHIESPVQRTYTLGQFFDEWGQPLGPDQAGPAKGHVTVIDNGRVFLGNPRNVPLTVHANIQLEVGTPLIAPETINWTQTGL
jgi:hypothetical protein